MRQAILLSVLLGGRFVRSAIDIDGNQVVDPIAEDDPSPISDINTYYPQQHDCPLPCTDYANIHSWVTYFSVDRLRRCLKPMLLQLSVSQSLNDSDATTLIRSCTLGEGGISVPENLATVENPKTTNALAISKRETEATCVASGVETSHKVQLFASGTEQEQEDNGRASTLIKGMQDFFSTRENCDEQFVFGYYNETVAGVYIGDGLGKDTIQSSLTSLTDRYAPGTFPGHVAAQACHSDATHPGNIFGITIENSRDLASVQETTIQWSKGHCFYKHGVSSTGDLPGARVLQIALRENSTLPSNATHSRAARQLSQNSTFGTQSFYGRYPTRLDKRATCSYITVAAGDNCPALVKRCGIANTDFVKYNPRSGLCAAGTLKQGDFVCCSAGDLPSAMPVAPMPGSDGVCATHLIQNGDTCTTLATKYGVTVDDIEKWNKKKTWAWTKCEDMLLGYNMCVSDGFAPMPPPAQGAECGPLVPGTPALTDRSISLADLNPCPLKACCSNWGYCGVFEGHCAIHAPPDSSPGTKLKEFQNSCVSNCDNEIKKNSAAPTKYERIGYYESWNMNRDCLWLRSEDANTDGTYTHIHWSFADIDPTTFKVIIRDEHKQWDGFMKLKNVKRIVSFGGWAYSTEEPGASILRRAIIDNRNLFATNLAQFAQDEGIEGIDIDWEYPGAPDIAVGGSIISQKTDGIEYLKFLTVLKQKMGTKLVSIAAPASYWYLKAFPIDRIASVIDYIVYMTYDLHGQWDYGNPNSFDSCDSGKCIRSHVNLTETDNALAMITKAGVPNNKIFVGESSYGRSFRMAKPGCWSSMCEFTGTRTLSDATPGRCTNTSGYLAQAEINELMSRGGVRRLYDPSSNTNVIIWDGNYVSFLDESSKLSRRERWRNLNFAGTIDWAVDLQAFSNADMEIPERPSSGQGCVSGLDLTLNTWDLCEFTCTYGFCPETLCECRAQGDLLPLPRDQGEADIEAWSPADVDITRLCKFACKYGYCPDDVCPAVVNDDEVDDSGAIIEQTESTSPTKRDVYAKACTVWKGLSPYDNSVAECKKVCQPQLDAAAAAGRTSNYGCQANVDVGTGGITWNRVPNGYITTGTCLCDNWLMNEIADTVLEAMPMIAQISCYVLMSSLKFVLDVGAQFVPVVGQALDIGLDMATTAAQMAAYLYPEEEDPEGAFSWWLSPCGGTDLVPEDIKTLFDTLSTVADGVSSFKKPKNLNKGSGKKGDDGNPPESDRTKPRSTNNQPTQARCVIRPNQDSKAWGKGHVWQKQECKNGQTHITQYVVTSLVYAKNAPTTTISKECSKSWEQACYHYSSAIDVNPAWATQPCHAQAASTAWRAEDKDLVATSTWSAEHRGDGWTHSTYRLEQDCHRDEYPPAYFMYPGNPIMVNGGKQPDGQLMRWLRGKWNVQAANMWKGVCFLPPLRDWTEKDYLDAEKKDLAKLQVLSSKSLGRNNHITRHYTTIQFSGTAQKIPEFTVTKWPTPPAGSEKGLLTNQCWPKDIAPLDPGFVLLAVDPYYVGKAIPYKYDQEMVKGSNGGP